MSLLCISFRGKQSSLLSIQGPLLTCFSSLIRDGSALPYTAYAAAPTITMPRVKAITTGSIPPFLDLILNFAESDTSSSLATQDTWIAQMKAKGTGKQIMYGDDTWLKLFPNTFDRAEGTSSFYVAVIRLRRRLQFRGSHRGGLRRGKYVDQVAEIQCLGLHRSRHQRHPAHCP